jgi:adenine-specific DNA methylase
MNTDTFVFQPMLTCIGNKRKLIPQITEIISELQSRIHPLHPETKLKIVDGFAGSGVVSRALLNYSSEIHCNDMELYSYIMACCHLNRPSIAQQQEIANHIQIANNLNMTVEGIICKLYAPRDTNNIQHVQSIQQVDSKLSFNNIDYVRDENNNELKIEAPKTISRLEEISEIRAEQRRQEAEDENESIKLNISDQTADLSNLDVHVINEPELNLLPDLLLDEIEVLE